MTPIQLFIIGAQKAGTTSLKNYLSEHPYVITHPQEEFAYFLSDEFYERGYERAWKDCGVNELEQNQILIAKNAGASLKETAIQRLKGHNPNCRLVFIVRNPVSRAISSYNMAISDGWMKRPLSEMPDSIQLFKDSGERDQMFRQFIAMGIYHEQLEMVMKYFPKDQIEIILFEEFKSNPQNYCDRLFLKLGLEPFLINKEKVHNEATKIRSERLNNVLRKFRNEKNPIKRLVKKILPVHVFLKLSKGVMSLNRTKGQNIEVSEELKAELKEFFKPYNQKFSELSGLDCSIWDK